MQSLYNLARKAVIPTALAVASYLPFSFQREARAQELGGLVGKLEQADTTKTEETSQKTQIEKLFLTKEELWNKDYTLDLDKLRIVDVEYISESKTLKDFLVYKRKLIAGGQAYAILIPEPCKERLRLGRGDSTKIYFFPSYDENILAISANINRSINLGDNTGGIKRICRTLLYDKGGARELNRLPNADKDFFIEHFAFSTNNRYFAYYDIINGESTLIVSDFQDKTKVLLPDPNVKELKGFPTLFTIISKTRAVAINSNSNNPHNFAIFTLSDE